MPEGRFVSKTVAHDLELNAVSFAADYLFTRMIPHLDVEGRMPGVPKQVRAIACPLRPEISEGDVDRSLRELSDADLIRWYTVEGRPCIEFPQFARHQKGLRKDREAASAIPPPDHPEAAPIEGLLLADEAAPETDETEPETSDTEVETSETESEIKQAEVETGEKARPKTPATSRRRRGDDAASTRRKLSEVKSSQENNGAKAPTSKPGVDPVSKMWAVFLDELGGKGRKPSLTDKRKKKLRLLYDEHLSDEDDPAETMRGICRAVKASDHHMSERAYQMPESLFRNPERRERWVMNANDGNGTNGSQPLYPRL